MVNEMIRQNTCKLCVPIECALKQVLAVIDQNAKGIALVVDDQQHLVATITDGDIRRAMLAGYDLNTKVETLVLNKASSLYPEPVTAQLDTPTPKLLELMQHYKIRQIPLLDNTGKVVDLAMLNDLVPTKILPLQAVVMAGGFGTRLRPLTDNLPKPMLPVGDRPLLELTIERLQQAGVRTVNITTHFMPEKIIEHFGDGSKLGVNIKYVSEDQPLGTAGALGLMDTPDEPLLVINGDILTQVDFRSMLKFHQQYQADLTVAVRQYDLQVPYGVLQCEDVFVQRLNEKPTYKFFVNAGIYLLQPAVHRFVPNRQRFDMTDLIQTLIQAGRSVVSFPIVEYWLDIGQHAEYQQAQKDLEQGRLSS
jgi:dTDP-glucose pyrophosphorylase